MPGRSPSLADPAPALADPDTKRRYTRRLFDVIAPRYDRFTRLFSFGMDARWKRLLVRDLVPRLPRDPVVLDLACGTGDLAELVAADRRTGGPMIGVDASAAMLERAAGRLGAGPPVRRSARPPVRLICADMTALPLADGSVDAVTIGYGLRNAPALPAALDEIARVLRPGGYLASLDFFLPVRRGWRVLFRRYLRTAGRVVGRWWHGEPHAYGYIDASLGRWLTAAELTAALEDHGLVVECARLRLGGGIAVHVARRADAAGAGVGAPLEHPILLGTS